MNDAARERAEAAMLPQDDIIGILLSQHAQIRELFVEIHRTTGEEKQARFDELRALLAVHETAEEMILRPVAKKEASAKEAAARNREEEEANKALAELEKMDIADRQFEARLTELEKSVGTHADNEERIEFPAVRSNCSSAQRQKMGKRLLLAEKVAPTHPHPAVAGSTAAQWAAAPFASLLDRARDALDSPAGTDLMGTGPASLGRGPR